ncbi:MAG: UTP--glucose-1-phosphate uridylyltransferase [Vulcanimicrobiota bacterium]
MEAIRKKMKNSGCSAVQIDRFCSRVSKVLSGERADIAESDIRPVERLTALEEVDPDVDLLRQVAIVKLNGGLGTSMGLTAPKGLLQVKRGHDFYSILHHQVESFAREHGFRPPLIFLNSFSTEEETRARLKELNFEQSVPWGFLQSQVPKIRPDGSLPIDDEEWCWCPPGHGDIYASLLDSGLRETLLQGGYRYLFVSNIDNLGAVLDSRAIAYMVREKLAFLMEVTRRGENDRKGGHLAHSNDGGLLLREVAQCPDHELTHFQDISKHRYFNTNNLWLDLQAVDESWTELPLIVNRKPLRPHQPESEEVLQLEQAMGAAISVVGNSSAIEVGRDRFAPVKTSNELFLLRSDLFELGEDFHLRQTVDDLPRVDLDPKHYKLINDFENLVKGVPSLKDCRSLKVEGAVTITADMRLVGDVLLKSDGGI